MRIFKSAVIGLIGFCAAAALAYLIYLFLRTGYLGGTVVILLVVLCGLGIVADIVICIIAILGVLTPPPVEEPEPLPPIDIK